jgi:hypothetical protein
MDPSEYKKGTLVPAGKWAPAIFVSYQISQKLVETKGCNCSFLGQRALVNSIAVEAGQRIGLGDFDLLAGNEIVRLKHVADDPEWLVLSTKAPATSA